MTKLAELQFLMQRAIASRSVGASGLVAAPPMGNADDRIAIYRHAYVERLTEFLLHDYEKLRAYLGFVRFSEMAGRYISAHPSDQPNARWFSRHLPEFLKSSPHYRRHPEIAELALLERAINDAFDGPDHPIVTMAQLAIIAPEDFPAATFLIAPTVHRFSVWTNVASLWSSLKCGETPPPSEDFAVPSEILVWRQGVGSRFRIVGAEEAMAFDKARDGLSFSLICETIAMYGDADTAGLRAATYLRGWMEAEIIAAVQLPGVEEK
jgi:hypothetical protein